MNNISTHLCPHLSLCSGCVMPLEVDPPIWKEALSFFEKFSIHPHLHIGKRRYWRLRAKLAVRGTPENPIIGLFKKGTHEATPIPHCLVHHPSINRAVSQIIKAIQDQKFPLYNEATQTGLLRYLQFFVERTTGRVQLALILNAQSTNPLIDQFCKNLAQSDLWHSIWINFNPEKTNTILSNSWQKISGEEFLNQPIGKLTIPFHPGAFAQAHLELFETLIETIQPWVPPQSNIVELFAGVGAIGLSLPYKKLLLIENNPFAKLSYRPHPNVTYLSQDANQFEDFASFDTLLVDPPRKGLGAPLLQKLSQTKKLRLIYISCGWDSFQKDSLALTAAGWTLKKAAGFLLFPGTNHVETVALFEV